MALLSPPRQPAADANAGATTVGGGFRPDIQGLRALAVGLVVLEHFTGWPSGGFIGVDVFFVISGYLISDLLLRELDRRGRISLREFYARRMRRIFPMAVVVLLATVAVAFALFSAARADSTAVDAFWALIFLENWHLAQVGTDYFRMGDAVSPVQQYWSLSVEEQYYLVWPLLLITITSIAAWWARKPPVAKHGASGDQSIDTTRLRAVGWVLALITVSSFVWAVVQTNSNATYAYFSTLTRAWELAAGALLAVWLFRRPLALDSATRGLLTGFGLAAIIYAALRINDGSAFPGPWAALPVAATMLVLATAAGAQGLGPRILATSPMQFLGAISYSLYLWHFPVMVFVFATLGVNVASVATALAISLTLSVASYQLIEQPIRHSKWLSARSSHTAKHTEPSDAAPAVATAGLDSKGLWPAPWQRLVLSLSGVALVAAALTGLQPRLSEVGTAWVAAAAGPDAPIDSANAELVASPLPPGAAQASSGFDHYAALKLAQRQALETPAFPQLLLPAGWDDVLSTTALPECAPGPERSAVCDFAVEGSDKTAVLIGDSQMQAWLPGMRSALTSSGYSVKAFVLPGCTTSSVATKKFLTAEPNFYCDEFRETAIAYVESNRPNLTVVSSLMDAVTFLRSGATGDAAAQEWAAGTRQTLSRLAPASGQTVLLDSPPLGRPVNECQTRFAVPDDCEAVVTAQHQQLSAMQAQVVADVAATGAPAKHVSVTDWFCFDGYCPSFLGSRPTYADTMHVSPMYGEYVSPLLRQALLS